MPKYMITGSYSLDGIKGVLKEGGTGRQAAAKRLLDSVGGAIEAYYFVFGEDDFVLIADLPDNVTAAALSLITAATGALSPKVTVLLTPEELDAATKKKMHYRAPGE
jgi:uncharacterized protein with GYD domain